MQASGQESWACGLARVTEATRLFREYHLASGAVSVNWDAEWLDFVRRLQDERARQSDEEMNNADG
jgi:hypothetical protein